MSKTIKDDQKVVREDQLWIFYLIAPSPVGARDVLGYVKWTEGILGSVRG
jgi:hypothetical protein